MRTVSTRAAAASALAAAGCGQAKGMFTRVHSLAIRARWLPLTCAVAFALGCSPSGGSPATQAAARDGLATSVSLSLGDVKVQSNEGTAEFEGAPPATIPGRPALPAQRVRVLVGPDADLRRLAVDIEDAQEEDVPGTFRVEPAPAPTGDGAPRWPAGARIVDGKDVDVYGKNALYPTSNVGATTPGRFHGFKIVEVVVYPYRWNPSTGALRVLIGGRLVVRAAADGAASSVDGTALADRRQLSRLAELVVNFDAGIQRYGASAVSASGGEFRQAALTAGADHYSIITTNAIVGATSYLDAFVDAKVAQGFTVELITETMARVRQGSGWACIGPVPCGGGWNPVPAGAGAGAPPRGDAAAENLREWLRDNYGSHHLGYVLLIGNPDPGSGDVPMKNVWPSHQQGFNAGTAIPTDFYYAELSGDWDANGDGYLGSEHDDVSGGDPDYYPEVTVGRIPVYEDIVELDHILAKAIAYGNAAGADIAWRKNALLAMKPMDSDRTPTYQLGEWIRSAYLIPNGWASTRVYDQGFGVGPEITPCTSDNVVRAWTTTPRGLTVWMSHGSAQGSVGIINSATVPELDDLHPSVTFGVSCSNARPEDPRNLNFSLLENGAIAAVGATRDGAYTLGTMLLSGQRSGEALASGFARNLVTRDQTVGGALDAARTDMSQDWGTAVIYALYGDPSVSLRMSGSGIIAPPPAGPSRVTPGAVEGYVTLNWSRVPAASAYLIRRATTPGGPYVTIGTTSATSYLDATVDDGTTYYYVIVGRNAGGDGPASSQASATPPASIKVQYRAGDANPQDAVIQPSLRLVNDGTSGRSLAGITLRYWFTTDSVGMVSFVCDSATVLCDGVTSKIVPVSPLVGANAYLELGFATGATLAPGQSIEVSGRLIAGDFHAFDEGNDYSYDGTRTTYADSRHVTGYEGTALTWGDEPEPAALFWAPEHFYALAGAGKVTLGWGAIGGATAYRIYRATSTTGAIPIDLVTGVAYVDTTVTNGTTYSYSVTAVNGAGVEGTRTASVSVTPSASLPTDPPPVPENLTAAVANGVATLSWDFAQRAVYGYNLKRGTAPGGPYLTVAPNYPGLPGPLSTTVTGLTPGVTYYFVVTSVGIGGESAPSVEVALTTDRVLGQTAAKVSTPTAVSASRQVTLTWQPAARATGYVIKRMIAGGRTYQTVGTTTGATATTFVDGTSLVNGTVYTYVVAGTNAAGVGAASEPVSAMPRT